MNTIRRILLFLFLALSMSRSASLRTVENYDVILRQGTIIDGTGGRRYRADVGVRNGFIYRIGNLRDSRGVHCTWEQVAVTTGSQQALFLLGCGLDDIAVRIDPADARAHLLFTNEVKKLTLPHEMGELFKVIAFGRGVELPLTGFRLQDRRGRLQGSVEQIL